MRFRTTQLYTSIIAFAIGLCASSPVISQFCLDYPEIEGGPCGSCVPEGWQVESSSPDLFPPDQYPCMPGESPSGGNAMHLFSNGSSDIEAVSTDFEIPDFVPGSEYYFGLYYAACGPHDVEILIEINGEEYAIGSEQEWQYFELCVVPESPSVHIEITVDEYDSGMITNTLLDTGICDESFCCTLNAEIAEEYIELCPGDDPFEIELDVTGGVGTVQYEWTSDPANGVNFLDDPTSGTPILEIPYDEDFEGGEYFFTVEIEDEDCSIMREFELFVHPSEVPEFEVFLCELYEDYELPLMSEDGYFGTWEGNFYWDELGGTVQEYTFTLDPGQDNCIQEWTYEYPINFAEPVSFEEQTVYCVNDDETYRLPIESEERIEGEWDEDKFSPDELGVGIHEFVFYIDKENYCAEDYVLEIEVIGDLELNFDIPTIYCSSADSIFLPDTSLQGVAGMWTQNFIDLNSAVENQSLLFSSLDDTDCYGDYELIYSVESEIQNSFNVPDSVCRSIAYIEFDSMSLEGYLGYWTPSAVSLDSILTDVIEIEWTPLDSNDCLQSSNLTVHLTEQLDPEFDLPSSLCAGSGLFELENISLNGIEGTWNISSFDPDSIMSTSVALQFTPDLDCAVVLEWQIDINNQTLDKSEFDLDTILCLNDSSFDLPTSSISGVTGSWSQATIDPSSIMDSLVVTFNPNNSANSCYDTLDYIFYVSDLIVPSFDLPLLLCAKADRYIFPNESLEGIMGSWDISEFNPGDLPDVDSLFNSFYPDDPSCYAALDVAISLYDFSGLDYSINDPVSCSEPDGSIAISSVEEFDLSIDDGVSWIESDRIDGLDAGDYILLVQNRENSCMDTIPFSLIAPESVRILELQIDSISDCSMQGGSVVCIAEGSDLEYQINDQTDWTQDMAFEDLSVGEYWIYVRDSNSHDCIDSMMFELDAFEETLISDVISNDVSDCEGMDGRIEIFAQGQNLEYSINSGEDWQIDPVFDGLRFGIYEIIVRSMDANDCFDESQAIINSPEVPMIDMVDVVDQSSCIENNGSIQIHAEGSDLEYSIDGGINWFDTNLFEDLSADDYVVSIRERNAPDCFSSTQVELHAPVQLQILNSDLQQPSNCFDSDASLELSMNDTDVQYSIDGGTTWQTENRFSDLEEGSYTVLIENPDFPDCGTSFSFDVSYPPCPCNVLSVELTWEPVDCLDPVSGSVSIESIEGNIIDGDLQVIWDDGTEALQLEDLTEGWVSYTIYYDKNCEQQDSVLIETFDPISFDLLSFDQDCEGLGMIEVSNFMGGAGDPSYSIDGINFQDNTVFTGLSAQEYQVFIEDLFNCSGEDSVVINDNSDLQLELPGVEPISLGESRFLNPLINEATIDSFEWYPMDGVLNPGNLVAQVSPEETTTYTLTIYFGDCVEIRSVTVEVLEDPDLYIANLFSPNGDGNNDLFVIQSNPDLDLIVDSFRIYDRWGNLVYEATDFKTNSNEWAWDGRKNDREVLPGVYVYTIDYAVKDELRLISGSVTLVR